MKTIRLFGVLFLMFICNKVFCQVPNVLPTVPKDNGMVVIYTSNNLFGISYDNKGIANVTSPVKFESEVRGNLSISNMILIYGYHYAYVIYRSQKDGIAS